MSLNTLIISRDTRLSSIENAMLQNLNTQGFVIIEESTIPRKNLELEKQIVVVSLLFGKVLASSAAYATLRKTDDDRYLAKHTEGIYACRGITPYFVLGCVKPAIEGGRTRVFSACQAAALLQNEHPDLASVEIEYKSVAYPKESAVYPLCVGGTLRYRGKTPQNRILNLPKHYSEEKLYVAV